MTWTQVLIILNLVMLLLLPVFSYIAIRQGVTTSKRRVSQRLQQAFGDTLDVERHV